MQSRIHSCKLKPFNLIPFIVFFSCCSLITTAQEYSYKHYEIKDGLVGNNVYDCKEDKEGFIWFATETGVSRFDGTNFRNFTTAERLSDNEILKIFVDSRNRVWMMPFRNTICYFYKGKFYNAGNDTTLKKFNISDRVLGMIEDRNGDIIFFETNAVHVLRTDNTVLERITPVGVSPLFFGAGFDNQQNIYGFLDVIPEGTRRWKINISNDRILFEKSNDSIKFRGNRWTYSYITPDVFIYLNNYDNYSDYAHLVFNNYIKHQVDTIALPESFNLISFINDSLLIFNTGHGALEYNYQSHTYGKTYLATENISSTMKDHEDNIWLCTLGNGVFRLRSGVNSNLFFRENNSVVSVDAVSVRENRIVVGTDRAKIYELTKGNGKIISNEELQWDKDKIIKFLQYDGEIYSLFEYSLYKINSTLKKLEQIPICSSGITRTSYKDIDIKGSKIYFASHGNVFLQADDSCRAIYDHRATAICIVDSGIYIGSLEGLMFLNKKNIVINLGENNPLLKSRVTRLLLFKNKLWVGTNDNGVICYDGQKIEKTISVKNGLTGNLVRVLYADGDFLWIGTDRGLNKIGLADSTYPVLEQYTNSDGLLSSMINAVFVQEDTVYVGTSKGLNFFDDREMSRHSICNLKVLGITVSGKEMQYDSSTLILKHRDNNIRFDFVAISFKSEGNIVYYYKLSGIDTDWQTTRENFLLYPTLPSGQYDLELYAVNKFGVKSAVITIHFDIEKRLIEEAWFIMLLILCSMGIALFLANWRIRRVKKIQKEKMANAERIAALEQQALKAQMNPHFIFNCLNSIQQYVIDKDVQGANKFISGFSKLIRQTLYNSGKHSITVSEEEGFLRSYLDLEKSRFEDKFDYSIWIDERIHKDEDSLPPMLLQPYIENCIRHGIMHKADGKGIIDIRFNVADDNLVCTVADNGIGRKAANNLKSMQHISYQSKGTELTGQRIMMINKKNAAADIILNTEDLVDEQGQPSGTMVTIVIPLQKAN